MPPITVPYQGWSCNNLPAEDSRWTRPGLPTKNKTLFINNNSSLLTLKMPESKLPMLTMEQQCSLVPPHTFTLIWPDNGPGWLGWLRLTEGDWVWLGWLRLTGVTEGPSLRLTEADWGWLRVNEDDWGFLPRRVMSQSWQMEVRVEIFSILPRSQQTRPGRRSGIKRLLFKSCDDQWFYCSILSINITTEFGENFFFLACKNITKIKINSRKPP